ncbi:hypothetical protein CDL12_23974 [Handroanthus impetiginosus]|uniref:Uncharacterized protein n=1 Tax=Handroanthus impetiginosus TaxID=429701 RepID=A0A2G9GE63_9LAMI|nr:hypothetical protein CDL12_23974 [Handroanthus impetiginosus]
MMLYAFRTVMLRRHSVSHVLYETQRFFRALSSLPFPNYCQQKARAVTLCWFNECGKTQACPCFIFNRNLMSSSYFACGRISSLAVEHAIKEWQNHCNQYCCEIFEV